MASFFFARFARFSSLPVRFDQIHTGAM